MARGRVNKIKAWDDGNVHAFTLSTGENRTIDGETVYERQPIPLYKFLNRDGFSTGGQYGRRFPWPLPTKAEDGTWTPGDWVEPEAGGVQTLAHCRNGLHLFHGAMLEQWEGYGPRLFEVETDGYVSYAQRKWITGRARLLREVSWTSLSAWRGEIQSQRYQAETEATKQAEQEWIAAHAAEIKQTKAGIAKQLVKLPVRLKRLRDRSENHTANDLEHLLANIREAERMAARAKIILESANAGVYTYTGRDSKSVPIPEVLKAQRKQLDQDRKWLLILRRNDLRDDNFFDMNNLLYGGTPAHEANYNAVYDRARVILDETWVQPDPPKDEGGVDRTPFDPNDHDLFDFMTGPIFDAS